MYNYMYNGLPKTIEDKLLHCIKKFVRLVTSLIVVIIVEKWTSSAGLTQARVMQIFKNRIFHEIHLFSETW